jgi:hypothetical protein
MRVNHATVRKYDYSFLRDPPRWCSQYNEHPIEETGENANQYEIIAYSKIRPELINTIILHNNYTFVFINWKWFV